MGDGYQEYSLFLSAGLIYVLILYLLLIQKPNVLSLVAVAGLLGVTNFFVLYSNAVLILFPVEFTHYIVFVVPSLVGAVATLLCIKYIWEIYIHCKKCGIELTEEHRATMTGDDKPGRVDSLDGGFFVFLSLIVIFILGIYLL